MAGKNVIMKKAGKPVTKVSKTEALKRIDAIKGRFFTVTFITQSGEERTINCNKSAGSVSTMGYLVVNSTQDKGIRNIDTRTIKAVSLENEVLEIKKTYPKKK
jgi:hypothetical protein